MRRGGRAAEKGGSIPSFSAINGILEAINFTI
jgi:hypothetical protein